MKVMLWISLLAQFLYGFHLNQQVLMADDAEVETLASSITWCSSPEDVFIPKRVVVTPDPPKRGEKLTIKLEGKLARQVDQGTAHVKVKLGFIQLLDRDYEICDYVHEVDKQCPLQKGDFVIQKEVDLPAEVPPVSLMYS
jgi:hypothetical protein